jgi:hypothetical protein
LKRFAVKGDPIAFDINPMIGRLNELAVDLNAAAADPTARFGAGAKAGFGEDAVECF